MLAEEAERELVGPEEEGVEGDVPGELRAQADEEPAGALLLFCVLGVCVGGGWRVDRSAALPYNILYNI